MTGRFYRKVHCFTLRQRRRTSKTLIGSRSHGNVIGFYLKYASDAWWKSWGFKCTISFSILL